MNVSQCDVIVMELFCRLDNTSYDNVIIIIIIMGSYNARLIYPIGYSRRHCGATAALIRQPQTHPHNKEPEIRNRILWDGVRFLGVGWNGGAWRKPTKGGYGIRQTKFTYNHWLAALVKGKCTSTKPTHLATGVVCHPDTERNRPYKIPWSCRGLNRGPTAPQARTLPVCHTTPTVAFFSNPNQDRDWL